MALTDNVIAVYEFNESSGTTTADATGGGKTLTNFNGVAWTAGKLGNCVDLERDSVQFFTRADTSFSLGGNMTVSAWVNLETFGGSGGDGIALYTTNESEGDWCVVTNVDLPMFYRRRTGGSWGYFSGTYTTPSAQLPAVGSWTHLVFRDNGGTVTIWVNGASKSVGSFISDGGGWGQSNFCVGSFYPDPTWTYDGKIDQVAVWSRALSDSEIGQLYNGGAGLAYTSWGGGGAALTKAVADPMTVGETVAKSLLKTKSLSDAVIMNDMRGGVAAYARSVSNPMTVGEALAKLAALRRFDSLTMGENLTALRALIRALLDPLTLGENLAAVKAIVRTYADALILGELIDKQLTMAVYSDTFNRADSSAPGASWNENVTGVAIVSNTLTFGFSGSYASAVWTQPVAVSCQYQKATVNWSAGTANLIGFLFRCSNTTTGTCYKVVFDTDADIVYWENVANMGSPGTSTSIGSAACSIAPGDTIGVTLELLGNNTAVRIWLNPTGLPVRANDWNGDTTPNVTLTQNPATPRDTGTFLGLLGAPLQENANLRWDNWFGGGCLESTGQLWTKDLFDDLIVGEALATVAVMLRSYADPITLNEVLNRAAALQRYAMDPLALGENVGTARGLVRQYIDTLTLGEALAKTASKKFADALTLSEAFAKQLHTARGLADPMTVGEALVKAAQFQRAHADSLALGENLTIPLAGSKTIADALTLSEAWARVMALSRSYTDPVILGEALSRRINRALADLITLSEALAKPVAFNRARVDPITLGEAVAKQKQIGKALGEALAMGEALATVFVGIKTLADPLVLSEAVNRELGRGLTKSVADLISMAAILSKQLQAVRALADPLPINEALAKQAQFRRSLSDAITLGEALQKIVVLVRNITNAITLGEAFAKIAAYVRARADALVLGEALTKAAAYARAFPDSMTVADALAKSMTFRRAMSDLMTLGDTGIRKLLRQALADALTMGELVVTLKTFFRLFADPMTITDSVTKLFVLLRTFSDGLTLAENVNRIAAFHRLRADLISLAEAFAKIATYNRATFDTLGLGESFSRIATYKRSASDLLELAEAFRAARLLSQSHSDAIMLSDVVDTTMVLGTLATDRGQHRLIHGRICSRVN